MWLREAETMGFLTTNPRKSEARWMAAGLPCGGRTLALTAWRSGVSVHLLTQANVRMQSKKEAGL